MKIMSENQLTSVLNLFNISIEEICSMTSIEESDLYRLLNRSIEPDSYTLEKLSKILCLSQNDILRLIKLDKKRSENVVLYPVFTSFNKPFYVFDLCAFEDTKGISLNKYFSFIPRDLNAKYHLLCGEIVIYDSRSTKLFNGNCPIDMITQFSEEEYIADFKRSSIIRVTISL